MKKGWDRLGIAFSSVCIIHCIVVAFLPLFIPALAAVTHQPWVHAMVGTTVLFTTPLAFVPGYKKHGLNWIIVLAFFGLVLILGGYLAEDFTTEQVSHGISIVGSLMLVSAHWKNIQHGHRHHHQCC
jgi:MerC mercury resistance protein